MNRERLAALSGLVSEEVGLALADFAAKVEQHLAIVEVGSFRGKSTCYLASGAKNGIGAHVWAVDAWDLAGNITGRFGFAEPSTRETFDQQVKSMRLGTRVTAVQGFSVDVAARWDGPPVGLLFIDGDHTAEGVRRDWEAWRPHLAPCATVVFDDYDTPKNPGVRQVVDSLPGHWEVVAGQLAVGTAP